LLPVDDEKNVELNMFEEEDEVDCADKMELRMDRE